MEPNLKFESAEHELEALKKEVARLELAASGQTEEAKREAIKLELKKHIESAPERIAEEHKLSEGEIKSHAARISEIKRDDQNISGDMKKADIEAEYSGKIEQLLVLASDKGIYNAAMVAKETGDPYLEDMFRDELVKNFQQSGLKLK